MNRSPTLITIIVLALVLVLVAGLSVQLPQGAAHAQDPDTEAAPQQVSAPQAAIGTSFTYQGRLTDGGSLADGQYDLRFRLYDAASGGTLLGTVNVPDHTVVAGLFTVQLDFGEVFTGTARYLEIRVRPGASAGAFTTLLPRQELTAAPYALALPGLWTQQNATSPNLIGGYEGNGVADGVVGATIGGGGFSGFPNQVLGPYGTVGGGYGNTADGLYGTIGGGVNNATDGQYTTVGGGLDNTADGLYTTVGGGAVNTADGQYTTVGGGAGNTADGQYATVGGGVGNTADATVATVGGGANNVITVTASYATIGGGTYNQIGDDNSYATIGGGYDNFIVDLADNATISGGSQNTVSSHGATIGGGHQNEIGDNSNAATIGGGTYNTVGDNGLCATIPGGSDNEANAAYAFAAGRRANANNQGCFVWGDSTNADIACNDDNRTIFRSTGGFYIYTNSGLTTGAYLSASGGSWNSLSDRNVKENFEPVDTEQLLARLAEIPISTWNYKAQDPAIRHVGPMAQDFNSLLSDLGGEGETTINTLDADGVALAAIQGLYAQNQELAAEVSDYKAENTALKAENATQQAQIDDLEARLTALERGGVVRSSAPGLPAWLLLGGLVLTGGVVLQRRRVGGAA